MIPLLRDLVRVVTGPRDATLADHASSAAHFATKKFIDGSQNPHREHTGRITRVRLYENTGARAEADLFDTQAAPTSATCISFLA
jgi:hypothetical protein